MGDKEKATSKSYKIRISETAWQHLNDITGYISFINHQPSNAILIAEGLMSKIESIKNNPLAFKECEELHTTSKLYRTAIFKSWKIVFRAKYPEVVILGIISAAQSPSAIKQLRKIK